MTRARLKVRYRSPCRACGKPVQATPIVGSNAATPPDVYVRCDGCRTINRCPESSSSTPNGGIVTDA